MDYGKGLRRAREQRGVSQRALAQRIGLDPSYVAHIEAGRRKPSLDVLEELARGLDLSVPLLMLFCANDEDLRGIDEAGADQLARALSALLPEGS